MIKRLQERLNTRKMLNIQEFANRHKNFLVMVCDPRDDTMFMAHRGKQVTGRVSSADGQEHHVVKNVLKHSKFEGELSRLIGTIMDALKTPLAVRHCAKCDTPNHKGNFCAECGTELQKAVYIPGNTFYSFIDGALYRITKAIKFNKE